MPKLWLTIGLTLLTVAIGLYYQQGMIIDLNLSWEQFLYLESYFPVAIIVGVVLLLIAIVDFIANKLRG